MSGITPCSPTSFPEVFSAKQVVHDKIIAAIENGWLKNLGRILSLFEYDINYRDGNGKTFLHHAARHERIVSIKLLIDHGADRTIVDNEGFPPYMEAAQDQVFYVLQNYYPDKSSHDDGITDLMRAAIASDGEAISLLLANRDILIDVRDSHGENALSYALKKRADLDTVIMPLIQKGADVRKFEDRKGFTLIFLALINGYPESLLRLMAEKGANINEADNKGVFPLLHAMEDHFELNRLRFLVQECKANPDVQGYMGRTAIMLAMSRPDRQELVELFLQHEGSLEVEDDYGYTALFYAVNCKGCDWAFIAWLIQKGANPCHKSNRKESAAEIAARSDRDEKIITELSLHTGESTEQLCKMMIEGMKAPFDIFSPEKGAPPKLVYGNPANSSDAALSPTAQYIQRLLLKAAVVEGTSTQFDLKAPAMCGCAVRVALVSFLKHVKPDRKEMDRILEKGHEEYNSLVFAQRSANLLNARERYFYGKHLNWTGEILPHSPELALLSMEDRFTGTLKKGEEFLTFRGIFERLVKKIPEGKNELAAGLLAGAFFLGVIVKKEDQEKVTVGIYDPHGISEGSLKRKAFRADFSGIDDAAEFLGLLSFCRFQDEVSLELNPVIFHPESEGVISTPPLPENERVALLVAQLAGGSAADCLKALSDLQKHHPEGFKDLCQQLNPERWLIDLIKAHHAFETPSALIEFLIFPFLRSFAMDEGESRKQIGQMCAEKYKGNWDLVTFDDLADLYGQNQTGKYTEKVEELCLCLESTPQLQKKHLLGKYIYQFLRKEQLEEAVAILGKGIVEMEQLLASDMVEYEPRDLLFRSERSENLKKQHEVMAELQKYGELGYLSQECSSSLKEVESAFSKVLGKYFDSIVYYASLHPGEALPGELIEMERPFVDQFRSHAGNNKEIDQIFP